MFINMYDYDSMGVIMIIITRMYDICKPPVNLIHRALAVFPKPRTHTLLNK